MSTILKKLSGGDRRSVGRSEEAAKQALKNPKLLDNLFHGILQSDPIVRSRAAHAVKLITFERPELVQPYKAKLLKEVAPIEQWEVREQFCQLFPHLKPTNREVEKAAAIFKNYLNDKSSIVRTCAMQGLVDLIEFKPGLKAEIEPIINELTQTGTAAMRARGRMLLKYLQQKNTGK